MDGGGASFGVGGSEGGAAATATTHHQHTAPSNPFAAPSSRTATTPTYLPPSQPRHPSFAPVAGSSRTALPRRATEEEAQWSLKDILWQGRECKIITQNQNGPCSLIALCNILLLRGEITITPPDRPVVSYSYLSQLIAEHLLTKGGDGEGLEAALSTLPRTQYGLDVDVGFGGISEFAAVQGDGRQGGAGELALFRLCGVPLVHGWLPDPADTKTYQAVKEAGSYNRATDIVVRGDEVAEGAVVKDRGVGTLAASLGGEGTMASSKQIARPGWNAQHYAIVRQALALQSFLDSTSTQLTYHGLFVLAQELPAGQPVALFRNSHLSVLYKRLPNEGVDAAEASAGIAPPPTLFTLATDSSFLLEDEIVWESLVDVDGASSEFYDGKFRKSTMRQGDYVGRDADAGEGAGYQQNEDADYALAMQIYQNDQERLQRHQQRVARQSQSGRQSRSRYSQPPQAMMAPQPPPQPMFQTPNEVFTTMRYEAEPPRENAMDRLVILSLLPPRLRDEHHDLLGGFEGLSIDEQANRVVGSAPTSPTSPTNPFPSNNNPPTNPFLNAADSNAVPTTNSTNPFLNDSATTAAAPVVATGAATTHRLYRHIPLLAQHIERLQSSAGAICRAYSAVWSMQLLEQERSLETDRILEAIQSSLASSNPENDHGLVKGIRVAINKDGSIRVTQRSISAFPSTLEDAPEEVAPPSVRLDLMPTRVRTMDLEPLVFNKTDARGFYEAAKQRVGANSSVLSGVSDPEGHCFDVVLWNDEEADTFNESGTISAPRKLVTESSLANVVVELVQPDGRSRFVTPRTSSGMLDGLLRRWMVNKGIVEEEAVEVEELERRVSQGTAHVWLCNSLRGVWRVDLVEGPPRYATSGAGKANKNRFSQLMKGGSSSRSNMGPSAAASNTYPALSRPAPLTDRLHEQVANDLYGSKQQSGKGKKGKKGKEGKDKDCVVM